MPFTCSKLYSDIPFAHRQPLHDGHCRLVHGHNWSFLFVFAANERDVRGFVIDFGGLKELRLWLDRFDHALVLNEDDPFTSEFRALAQNDLCRLVLVVDSSCEGMAKCAFDFADRYVRHLTSQRVWVDHVVCFEDSRNSATYRP